MTVFDGSLPVPMKLGETSMDGEELRWPKCSAKPATSGAEKVIIRTEESTEE